MSPTIAAFLVLLMSGYAAETDNNTTSGLMTTTDVNLICPLQCRCDFATRAVDCSSSNLTSVDWLLQLLPTNCAHLNVSHNGVQTLNVDYSATLLVVDASYNAIQTLFPLRLPSLRVLDLSHNRLDVINAGLFAGLVNLEELRLHGNGIYTFHHQSLDIPNLRSLNLARNRLTSVDEVAFHKLQRLAELRLSGNFVSRLPNNVFKLQPSLETLSVDNNKLSRIEKDAFRGLRRLAHLDVSHNNLRFLHPGTFEDNHALSSLDLSGNPLREIAAGTFHGLNLRTLRLCELPLLATVENNTFSDLRVLEELRLTNNENLMFVSPAAFSNVPQLQRLFLHGNQLRAVNREIVARLPSLRLLTLYDNALRCDCNIYWLRREIEYRELNVTIGNISGTACTQPSVIPVERLNLGGVPRKCAPTIVPLFNASRRGTLGETFRANCKAVGVPTPEMHWTFPHPPDTAATAGGSERVLHEDGYLIVKYLQLYDKGDYRCVATNRVGSDAVTLSLAVYNMGMYIFPISAKPDDLTVSWNGTEIIFYQYQLLYREAAQPEAPFQQINVNYPMRMYTISDLTPATLYDVCISILRQGASVIVNCNQMRTRDESYRSVGIERTYVILVSILCTFGVLFLIGSVTCVGKVWSHWKRRRRKEHDNMSQMFLGSIDSMSDTLPITYENRCTETVSSDDDDDEPCSDAEMSEFSV
ncbi:PREDICTED: leucine-rich repeat and fibronectin type-III domain-containing protein 5-like [Priapulus caudatus]|uniref:Leucine-rich repeat and fibronectin type-III domain-containing protein 5-like n=1 Tax=Priapulus caudatus TaxID=37621 RepID=A0ABM1EDE0_PRICU|nr:PREDICTED: leucine-rich repeat and fibronectin type-III domain-containing protein 5-like [Priapulus caudatus]